MLKSLFVLSLFAGLNIAMIIIEKTTVLSDQSRVTYNVNDENKLDGAFTIIGTNDSNTLLRGLYKNGNRTGNWYAFNADGKIFLRYNYDLKKLLFLDTASLKKIDVGIVHNLDQVKKEATISFPIASIDQYISLLGTELKRVLISEDRNASGKLNVTMIAKVDKNGNAEYLAEYKGKTGFNVSRRLKINEKTFDLEWVPASYQGESLASIFTVKMNLDLSTPDNRQRFTWTF